MTIGFLSRLKLRSERGLALPLTVLVMASTGAMVVTVIEYSSSSGRTTQIAKSRVSAQSLAEAGIANALSMLNNAVDPKTPSTLPGPCTVPPTTKSTSTMEGGTVTWWGCYSAATYKWVITSVGSVPNPTGGAALTRTLTRSATVNGLNAGATVGAWSRMYHDNTSVCMTVTDVEIPMPVASRGDLCLVGSAKITGAETTVEVGDDVRMLSNNDEDDTYRAAGAGSGWTSSGNIVSSNGSHASTTVTGTRHATLVGNMPYHASGQFSQAVDLDGSNDYVALPDGSVYGLGDFTITSFVRLDSSSAWARLFDFGTGTDDYMYLAPRKDTNVPRFAITTSGGGGEQVINGTAAIATGSWVHVAVTKVGNTGRLYVNGTQVGSNTGMTLSPNSLGFTDQNWIGRSQYDDPYLNGRVDDFRIYNRGLSSTEIGTVRTGSTSPTGMIARYPFDGNANDSVGAGGPSAVLLATGFGFTIPADSQIRGIEAWVERRASFDNPLDDNEVYLLKAGAPVGSNEASGTNYDDYDETQYYGDDDELWGTTWTAAEINAANFGLRFRVDSTTPVPLTAYVDYIVIRVTYLPPPTTSIGTAALPVDVANIGGDCTFWTQPAHTPCSAADKVFATTITTSPQGLNKPQIDMAYWYTNAKPGPKQACTTTVGTPPVFDNDGSYNASLPVDDNWSEVTPTNRSYTCQVRNAGGTLVGELSWNHVSHELKILGTIFLDGDFRFDDNGQVVHYHGRGIIYAARDIEFDELVCAGGTGTASCVTQAGGMSNWDPTVNMMTVLAGDDSEFDQGSPQSVPSGLQGIIYAKDECLVHEDFHLSGPIICDEIQLPAEWNGYPTYYVWPPLGSLVEGQAYGSPNGAVDFLVTVGDQLG